MLSVSEGDLKERFKGEGITIARSEFKTEEGKLRLSYEIEFDSLQNLVKTKAFEEREISFYRDSSDNLAFKFVSDTASKNLFLETTAEEVKKELKIVSVLTLPGKVLESNADSEEESSLTWRFTKDKLTPDVMTAVCEGTGLAFVAKLADEPKKKAGSAYVYDPTGKPDPFRPFILEVKRPKETIARPLQPLQRYEISQLKLVGIIWMAENPRAMLEDAAGKGFIVSRGAYVGKNEGKITEIFQDEVIITEKSTDILGETKIKEITLKLHEQEAKSK
jgi:type IV pilus assembly protein PilP